MRSDIYKYQENYRAKYIVQILIFLLAIALLIISVVYIAVNQKADYNTSKILIFVIIFGCLYLHPFGKYKNRYHLNLVFDDGKIAVLKKNRATAVKIDKSQEIWVLPTSQFRYVQYMPYMSIEKGSLVIIGNQASFEDERVVKLTNGYNDYLRHLNQPFGRGYISIIYREPLRDWLNLYNKQIYRDQFPVASYKHLRLHNNLAQVSMHH